MKVAIGSRRAYSHITGKPTPPEPGDEDYDEWEEIDLIVFSWIVDNIEDDIIADFAHHQTAKAIWDSLAVTFESTADPYLIYDLEERANAITQGNMDLETYYRGFHGLWINVDRCKKQLVDCCDRGISKFREHTTTRRLIKFLAGLNECYDSIRKDVLNESNLPSVEAAYGWVKREAARRKIMPPTSVLPTTETRGSADSSSGCIGYGFGAQNHCQQNHSRTGPPTSSSTARGTELTNPTGVNVVFSLWNAVAHTRDLLSIGRRIRLVGGINKRREERQPSESMKQGESGAEKLSALDSNKPREHRTSQPAVAADGAAIRQTWPRR